MFAPRSGPMCRTATRCKLGSALSHLFISTHTKWPFLQCLLINTDWNIKLSEWCQILHGRNNGAEITTTELKLIDTVSCSSFPEAKWSHKVMLHRVISGILQWYCISCVTFTSCGMPHLKLCEKLYAFPKAEIFYEGPISSEFSTNIFFPRWANLANILITPSISDPVAVPFFI